MRVTLEEKLKEAFSKAGQALPMRPPSIHSPGKGRTHLEGTLSLGGGPPRTTKSVDGKQPASRQPPQENSTRKRKKKVRGKASTAGARARCKVVEPITVDLSVYRQGISPKAAKVLSATSDSPYEISLASDSSPCWDHADRPDRIELLRHRVTGQQCQLTKNEGEERELVIGLDFGTSSVKVVIGDSALKKAFAVPFRNTTGLPGYLLPCRLYEEEGAFHLEGQSKAIADIKLAYLAHPSSVILQQQIVAFLALVIRKARAWLFCEKEAIYRSSHIAWRMALGFPAANHLDLDQTQGFKLLGTAAWILAGNAGEKIDASSVALSILRAEALEAGAPPTEQEDIELSVIPEIAAQIYGYVASEAFDPKAANNFMMVDVGAGTVDASLFHVKRGRGKWDFEFYTATVKPLGAVNLHRSRLDWWADAIHERTKNRRNLIEALEAAAKVTDYEAGIPDSLEAYFSNSNVKFLDPRQHHDRKFFASVFEQVGHETYWKTSRGHLTREQLTDIPVYLCGGGSRMPFYGRLKEVLNNHPSLYKWMKVKIKPLALPKRLEAPGLARTDFDRLSVAYGLSFLNLGQVLKSVPKAVIPITASDAWRDNYLEK